MIETVLVVAAILYLALQCEDKRGISTPLSLIALYYMLYYLLPTRGPLAQVGVGRAARSGAVAPIGARQMARLQRRRHANATAQYRGLGASHLPSGLAHDTRDGGEVQTESFGDRGIAVLARRVGGGDRRIPTVRALANLFKRRRWCRALRLRDLNLVAHLRACVACVQRTATNCLSPRSIWRFNAPQTLSAPIPSSTQRR